MPLLLLMLGRAVFASQTLSILRTSPAASSPLTGQPRLSAAHQWRQSLPFRRDRPRLDWTFFYLRESSHVFFNQKSRCVSMMSLSVNADFAKNVRSALALLLPQCDLCSVAKATIFQILRRQFCRWGGQKSVDVTMRWSWSMYQHLLRYATHICAAASHLKVIIRSEMGFSCARARSHDELFLIKIKTMSMVSFFKLAQL